MKVTETEVVRNPGIPVIGAIYSEVNLSGNGSSATISGADNCGIVADVTVIYTLDPATSSISREIVIGVVDHGGDDLDLGNYNDSCAVCEFLSSLDYRMFNWRQL